MRVCHLGKYYPPAPGGIETHVRTLARAQAAAGLDVSVLCVNHANRRGVDTTWARYGATQTVDETELVPPATPNTDLPAGAQPDVPTEAAAVHITRVGRSATVARLDLCPQLPRILRELNRHPPDLLHLHTPNVTMLLAVAVLTSPAVPLVITHHSDIVKQRWLRWALTPYERRVYERAACVLTSAWAYVAGSELLTAFQGKVDLLPMGLDLEEFLSPDEAVLAEESKLRRQLTGPLWLAVGRCVYYKGLHTAVEALRHTPGTLMIVGRGPLQPVLRTLAERCGVADRIRWVPYATATELAAAYRVAQALWFPSNARSEAFGLVQVEAMASACPVINTDIPNSGVAWVSRHGETGLTVPMNDPEALAAAARSLLDDRGYRDRLGAAARLRAISEFSHDIMARRSIAVYERVASHRPSPHVPTSAQLSDWVSHQQRQIGRAGT